MFLLCEISGSNALHSNRFTRRDAHTHQQRQLALSCTNTWFPLGVSDGSYLTPSDAQLFPVRRRILVQIKPDTVLYRVDAARERRRDSERSRRCECESHVSEASFCLLSAYTPVSFAVCAYTEAKNVFVGVWRVQSGVFMQLTASNWCSEIRLWSGLQVDSYS